MQDNAPKTQPTNILFASPADWRGVRGRFQHLASIMAQHNRVLYLDTLGMRPATLRPDDLRRMTGKLGHFVRRDTAAKVTTPENLRVVSPLVLPLPPNRLVRAMNQTLLRRFVNKEMAALDFRDPLVWIAYPHPDWVAILDQLGNGPVIYDVVDAWGQFNGLYSDLVASEEKLLRRADLVFSTAPALREHAAAYNPRSFLVPNGVDVERFCTNAPQPADLASIPRPRLGFIGNIAEWVNVDLMVALARAHPDWHIVIVGPWQRPGSPPSAPNLHWLGTRPYTEVPNYLASFDACLIPFAENDLTRAVDPLKLYEYLAAGCPVIATPLPSASPDLLPLVYWAQDLAGFEAAITQALDEPDSNATERREAIKRHSWEQRMSVIANIIHEHLGVEIYPNNNENGT